MLPAYLSRLTAYTRRLKLSDSKTPNILTFILTFFPVHSTSPISSQLYIHDDINIRYVNQRLDSVKYLKILENTLKCRYTDICGLKGLRIDS
jgi:hypothetical protein